MDASRVSVVMSVRDGERYVAEAVESILDQSVAPGEIVVVDDGSRDRTAEILARYEPSVRCVPQARRGFASGLNRGVAETTGDVLAFLDADDVWTETSLEVRLARLDGADEPEGVFGRTVQFVSPELQLDRQARFRFDPGPSSAPLLPSLVVRRDAAMKVGPFDESLPSAANIDWISRVRSLGVRLAEIDAVVVRRRLHQDNMGLTMPRGTTLAALRSVVRTHHARRGSASSGEDGVVG